MQSVRIAESTQFRLPPPTAIRDLLRGCNFALLDDTAMLGLPSLHAKQAPLDRQSPGGGVHHQNFAIGNTMPVNSDQSCEALVKPFATPQSMVIRLLGL